MGCLSDCGHDIIRANTERRSDRPSHVLPSSSQSELRGTNRTLYLYLSNSPFSDVRTQHSTPMWATRILRMSPQQILATAHATLLNCHLLHTGRRFHSTRSLY